MRKLVLRDRHSAFDSGEGPTGETTFGATHTEDEDPEQRNDKVDYYDVALRISLKITFVAQIAHWNPLTTLGEENDTKKCVLPA